NIAAPRADGLANADFPGPFGDRDQHDVHHTDAADQQADGRNHHHDQADRGDELAELADDTLGAGDAEVIGVGGFDAAAAAEQFRHLVFRLIHLARLHQHADEVVLGFGVGL